MPSPRHQETATHKHKAAEMETEMTRSDHASRISVARKGYALSAEIIRPAQAGAAWIVFGNSLVTDLSIWDDQVAALAGRFGILRYDQAGHGASGIPSDMPDFDMLGADLLAVMDATGVRRAIYVGLSMGVPTGLAAHAAQPDRFDALVLVDGQSRTASGGRAAWAERIAAAEGAGMAAFAAATADRWLTTGADNERRARLIRMIAATPLEGFRACATALIQYDYADELPNIRVPTLLIAGAEDGAIPQTMAANLQPNIADAQLALIPNAGHVPCFEQPEAFTKTLERFLSRLGADAASNFHSLDAR